MITKTLTIAKKFYYYQRERFPVLVLAVSLIPAVLSSGVIVSTNPTWFWGVAALFASLAYLLHIRVIDEHRDFGHDNEHHSARPIQSGIISKQELRYVDAVALLFLLVIAAAAGWLAFACALLMLGYSFLAGKEFFMGESIRRRFFIYNAVNLAQMLLMQLFVYAVFVGSPPFPFSVLLAAHFLFTTVGTIVFEFVRKLKIPGRDGTGKDTYTWYLGFGNSMLIYTLLLSANILLFFWIAGLFSPYATSIVLFTVCVAAAAYGTALVHWIQKTHRTDQLMQLSFLLAYGALNIAIYVLAIH